MFLLNVSIEGLKELQDLWSWANGFMWSDLWDIGVAARSLESSGEEVERLLAPTSRDPRTYIKFSEVILKCMLKYCQIQGKIIYSVDF